MSRAAEYQAKMIARKAMAAGMSVEDFLTRGEREHAITMLASRARYDRAFAHSIIARGASARGNTWS